MSSPTAINLYGVGVGTVSTSSLGLGAVVSATSPATTSIKGSNGPYALGQLWVNYVRHPDKLLHSRSRIQLN